MKQPVHLCCRNEPVRQAVRTRWRGTVFAVTPRLSELHNPIPGQFSVTHIPTGRAVCHCGHSLQDAKQLAKAFEEHARIFDAGSFGDQRFVPNSEPWRIARAILLSPDGGSHNLSMSAEHEAQR